MKKLIPVLLVAGLLFVAFATVGCNTPAKSSSSGGASSTTTTTGGE